MRQLLKIENDIGLYFVIYYLFASLRVFLILSGDLGSFERLRMILRLHFVIYYFLAGPYSIFNSLGTTCMLFMGLFLCNLLRLSFLLQIDFSLLIDVRIVRNGDLSNGTSVTPKSNVVSAERQDVPRTSRDSNINRNGVNPLVQGWLDYSSV